MPSDDPVKIFICYAREDREPLESLRVHLAPLVRTNRITIWYDKEIKGGKDWDQAIKFNLKQADIVLLLISNHFFDSDYIETVELREALDGHAQQENLVVPVILKRCHWTTHTEIARLQALPEDAKPVFDKRHWDDPEDAYFNIVESILNLLDDPDTQNRRTRKQARLTALAQAAEKERLEAEEAKAAAEKRRAKEHEEEAALAALAQAAEKERLEAEKAKAAAESHRALEREEDARRKALPDMVSVKGGTFQMDDAYSVTLSDYAIGKYPVTQKWWKDIMGKNPSSFKGDDLPVENVSWKDAQEFLKKLNARFPGYGFRLPTEAEWEFAARGGALSKGFEYSGDNDLKEVGWFDKNAGGKTHPVGQKKANELDIFDMSGNVWEWCADWYGAYPKDAVTNPKGPNSGSSRVIRGGSWFNSALLCRVAYRFNFTPDDRDDFLGFRLASSPQ